MVPGAWRNFFIAVSKPASPEPFGSSLPAQRAGRDAGDHRLGGAVRLAVGQPHAGRPAAGRGDLGDIGCR